MDVQTQYSLVCEEVEAMALIELEQLQQDGKLPADGDALDAMINEVHVRAMIRKIFPGASEKEALLLHALDELRRALALCVNTRPRTPRLDVVTENAERKFCETRAMVCEALPIGELTPLQRYFIETEMLDIPFSE